MTPIPSGRLVTLASLAAVSSLAVTAFPEALLLLLTADVILIGAALLDWLLTPGPGLVEVRRVAAERMSVLQDETVTLVVRNQSRTAVRVRLRDAPPAALAVPDEEVVSPCAALGESRLGYRARPVMRGRFVWGPIVLRYRSVLGLWEWQKTVPAADALHVYPNLAALNRYHLLARAQRTASLGLRSVRVRGSAWEFESLREYTRGDDVRLMDWKATARRHRLIIRNQQAERNQTVLLLLDCGRLMNAEEAGVAKLDHAVNTALLLSHVALSRGDRVGLCAFSHRVHTWVTPRPHLGQMRLITDALYDLKGDFTETDHGRCLRQVSIRHRKRALLVVLTDFVDAVTSAEMVAHLQRAGRTHLVLFVALKDPFLERFAGARPKSSLEGFRKAAATDLLHERREVLERLRQQGAHVLDVEPSEVTLPLLNRYLEITFRGEL